MRQPGRFVCCTSMPLVELSLMLWNREFVSEPVMMTMVMMMMMMYYWDDNGDDVDDGVF